MIISDSRKREHGETCSPAVLPAGAVENALFMQHSPLFAGISHADCLVLARCASIREYSRDDYLFQQGQPLRNVLLVLSGCVKLTQISSDGNEVILWLRGSHDAVGIYEIPMQGAHSCSARVIIKCRALAWDWAQLSRGPANPQIRGNIAYLVAKRLCELEERFREIATERVSRRVASAIGRILEHVGRPSDQGIVISLSREELAQLTGTTLFSVSRLMSRWNELGIVIPRREGFVVRDPDRLQQPDSWLNGSSTPL